MVALLRQAIIRYMAGGKRFCLSPKGNDYERFTAQSWLKF